MTPKTTKSSDGKANGAQIERTRRTTAAPVLPKSLPNHNRQLQMSLGLRLHARTPDNQDRAPSGVWPYGSRVG
jgi:hypothetical protein